MPGIHPDITTAFGNTPLVRLHALTEGLHAEVLAKLEFYNPGASVKDRLGYALVEAAEASGELVPGGGVALRWPDGELTDALPAAVTGMGRA